MALVFVLLRSTGKEFALKIIDKAKCCGKVVYYDLHVYRSSTSSCSLVINGGCVWVS